MKNKIIFSLFFLTGALFLIGNVVFASECTDEKIYANDATCDCSSDTQKCSSGDNNFYCRDVCWCDTNDPSDGYPSCECKFGNVLCVKDGKYACMLSCINGWVLYGDEDDDNESGGDDDDGDSGSTSGGDAIEYTGEGLINPIGISSLSGLLIAVAKWLEKIGLILAPLFFVIGGLMFITANGDTKKIDNGKKLMVYTAIGILVILLAESLATALQGFIQ